MCAAIDEAWRAKALRALAAGQRPSDIFRGVGLQLPRTLRLAVHAVMGVAPGRAPTGGLTRNSRAGAKRPRLEVADAALAADTTTPAGKLIRFLRLLDHLGKAPWASSSFAANNEVLERLTAAHLGLIVGVRPPPPELFRLIGGVAASLERCENLIWITNRQQGKTTSMGRFIAALSLQVQSGGTLACVYSTKQDRAAELCKAAKDYMYWMQTDEGRHPEWPSIVFEVDNMRQFTVRTGPQGSPAASVYARPKNADACRGDAPMAAFFDEIAFTSPDFWYKFALPLLQIRERRFTCTTTPPPPRSFFDSFCDGVREANRNGATFFELLNHSLACSQCIDDGIAADCCHRLHLVPPWKSLLQFNSIGALMPKNRAADFAAEVFGVMKHDVASYLPERIVNRCFVSRGRLEHAPTPLIRGDPLTFWVGVDLAGHSKSELGLAAIVGVGGTLVVVGVASISVAQCQMTELQAAVRRFVAGLRTHPWATEDSVVVPIIECNLNEVMAMTLLTVFEEFPPVYMPFTPERFGTLITPGVGVWTTEDTKVASLQVAYQALLDNQLSVAKELVVVGRNAFDPRAKPPCPVATVELLRRQLTQFSTDDKGKVTGKTPDGDNDDLGMAFLLAIYWRIAVMSRDTLVR